jgi:hypothetical protein
VRPPPLPPYLNNNYNIYVRKLVGFFSFFGLFFKKDLTNAPEEFTRMTDIYTQGAQTINKLQQQKALSAPFEAV